MTLPLHFYDNGKNIYFFKRINVCWQIVNRYRRGSFFQKTSGFGYIKFSESQSIGFIVSLIYTRYINSKGRRQTIADFPKPSDKEWIEKLTKDQ
ncbi:hypothetical protein CSV74_04490 [Sporosarcina sp. P19]|nr:hypothetical protein CSV74_04490 [Sporosarcina sp. P19]